MKQSQLMSFVESAINILVGFGIACAAQAVFLPMLGVPIPWGANLAFAGIMTVISIARSYALRRVFEALHIRRPLSPFMQAVIAECFRQREVEGYDTTHDDSLPAGELARAGAAYAIGTPGTRDAKGPVWPWSSELWKPDIGRRRYVKSAALIIAEGERFDRQRSRRVLPEHSSNVPMPAVKPTMGARP